MSSMSTVIVKRDMTLQKPSKSFLLDLDEKCEGRWNHSMWRLLDSTVLTAASEMHLPSTSIR